MPTPHTATSHSTTNLPKDPVKVGHNTLKGSVLTECADKTSKVENFTKELANLPLSYGTNDWTEPKDSLPSHDGKCEAPKYANSTAFKG